MLVGVADSAMVGQLGPAPLGASSLGHGAFMLIFIFAMGLAMAAHQIALSLAALTFMVASGLAAATTIRVGNQLGLGNIRQLRNVVFVSLAMGIAIMASFGISFALADEFF